MADQFLGLIKRISIKSAKKNEDQKKVEPLLLSLPLSEEHFRNMIFSIEEKELWSRLPNLDKKNVLEISPRQKPFAGYLKEKGARVVVRLGGTKESEDVKDQESFILSHWESLPFLDSSIDLIFLRTSFLKTGFGKLFREAGRVLAPGGTMILSDFHPFQLFMQKMQVEEVGNSFASEEKGLPPGFERYWKLFGDIDVKIDWIKEIFFDVTLKKYFGSESQQRFFEKIRKTPFLIFFVLKKVGEESDDDITNNESR